MASEAVVASEAAKRAQYHVSNMHMVKKLIGVTDLKSEFQLYLQGCLEAVVTSEASKRVHAT